MQSNTLSNFLISQCQIKISDILDQIKYIIKKICPSLINIQGCFKNRQYIFSYIIFFPDCRSSIDLLQKIYETVYTKKTVTTHMLTTWRLLWFPSNNLFSFFILHIDPCRYMPACTSLLCQQNQHQVYVFICVFFLLFCGFFLFKYSLEK